MNAQHQTSTETRTVKRSCRADGCACEDSRIVSPRRAAFFAALARAKGDTADRQVAPEADWRIPPDPVGD
jgi:hypothetical protein